MVCQLKIQTSTHPLPTNNTYSGGAPSKCVPKTACKTADPSKCGAPQAATNTACSSIAAPANQAACDPQSMGIGQQQ